MKKEDEQMIWLADHLISIYEKAYPESGYLSLTWIKDENHESLMLVNEHHSKEEVNPLDVLIYKGFGDEPSFVNDMGERRKNENKLSSSKS